MKLNTKSFEFDQKSDDENQSRSVDEMSDLELRQRQTSEQLHRVFSTFDVTSDEPGAYATKLFYERKKFFRNDEIFFRHVRTKKF